MAGPGLMDIAGRHVGTVINAAAFILVVFLVVWFGLRPMTAALNREAVAQGPSFDEIQKALPSNPQESLQIAAPDGEAAAQRPRVNPIDELRNKLKPAPQERLARMLELNEERTAQILRKWAHQEAS